jgi:hypothetical protein
MKYFWGILILIAAISCKDPIEELTEAPLSVELEFDEKEYKDHQTEAAGFEFDIAEQTTVSYRYTYYFQGTPFLAVMMGESRGDSFPTTEQFYALFQKGLVNFATPANLNGITLIFALDSITQFSSKFGPQTDSEFEIDEIVQLTNAEGVPILKYKASFDCRLYDQNGGNMKKISGKIIGLFQKYQK